MNFADSFLIRDDKISISVGSGCRNGSGMAAAVVPVDVFVLAIMALVSRMSAKSICTMVAVKENIRYILVVTDKSTVDSGKFFHFPGPQKKDDMAVSLLGLLL